MECGWSTTLTSSKNLMNKSLWQAINIKPSYITKHLTRYKNKKNLESSERPASIHKHEGSKATQEVCLLKNPFQEKPIGKNLGVGKKSTTLTWHSPRENNKHLESSIYPTVVETEGLTSWT